MGVVPALLAVNEGIFPARGPPTKPIAGLLFVHVIAAPVGKLDNVSGPTITPAHTVILPGTTAAGV